jgi:hypothetical protein
MFQLDMNYDWADETASGGFSQSPESVDRTLQYDTAALSGYFDIWWQINYLVTTIVIE